MEMKKEWLRAIDVRTAIRTYRQEKIGKNTVEQIQKFVDQCNSESGLSVQFVENGSELFQSFSSSYGLLHGVPSFFALTGNKELANLRELCGYYGELIVLECTSKNLATCWVSGTFDKEVCRKMIGLKADEELICVIAVGLAENHKRLMEKALKFVRKNSKKPEEFIEPNTGLPGWALGGVEAVAKAPSAMNKKPVHFTYQDGTVKAQVPDRTSYQGIDLGIAMAHFELGAWGARLSGKWKLQNGEHIFQCI